MATLLGVQLIITLIAINLVHRLSPIYSFARWTLCSTGLVRFLHPTDKELRQLLGLKKKDSKQNKRPLNGQNDNVDVFQIPKNLDISLQCQPIQEQEIYQLRYFMEYQWLVNFSLYAVLVYLSTEIYSYYSPIENEINLSMLWCSIVIVFAFKILMSLTLEYFRGGFESSGERSTVIVSAFVYLVVAMIILVIDESKLDVRLDTAYKSFNESSTEFLHYHGLSSQGPASKLIVKFCLALWCAVTGAMFIFPGIRTAKMHWDCLKYYEYNEVSGKYFSCSKAFIKGYVNFSLLTHFLLVLLWVKPIAIDLLTAKNLSGLNRPLMTLDQFESLRCWMVVLVVIQRLCMMPVFMQSYLNMAQERLEQQKKEAGRITNKDLQKQVAVIFYYTCVVVLQYVIPLIMILFFTFFYKTLGDFSWVQVFANPQTIIANTQSSIEPNATYFSIQSLKQVLTADVYRGIFGFATWWICFAWFLSLSVGVFYQSYLSAN